jgi:rubrerythrin
MTQAEDMSAAPPACTNAQGDGVLPRRAFLAEALGVSATATVLLTGSNVLAQFEEDEVGSTADRLRVQFSEEARVAAKYAAFASQARIEGRPQTASLFRALAMAETFHAEWVLRQMNDVATTADNLNAAADYEALLVEKVLPAAVAQAGRERQHKAETLFEKLTGVCAEHEKVLRLARERILAGRDTEPFPIRICPDCGSVFLSAEPDRCPVCGAAKVKFIDA